MFTVISIFALIFFDQLIKMWAASILISKPQQTVAIIKDVLHLTYVENRGAAFGILENMRWLFITSTIILVIYFSYRLIRKSDKLLFSRIGVALIIAGGAGNLIDRIFRGYVIDYVDFRLINFAVFNLADSCVVIGTILFCIGILLSENRRDSEPISQRDAGLINKDDKIDDGTDFESIV